MNLMDFREPWNKIVDKGIVNYKSLSQEERVWFNIEPLITGGLWSHYVNYGADNNSDTIEDLKYLGFHSIANQLRDFNTKYFPEGVPIGPDSRQEQLDTFPDDEIGKHIEDMDDEFWKVCDELEAALVKHIDKYYNV